MLAHYQAHMNNQKDQSEFFKHLQSSDSNDFNLPSKTAGIKQNRINLPSIG